MVRMHPANLNARLDRWRSCLHDPSNSDGAFHRLIYSLDRLYLKYSLDLRTMASYLYGLFGSLFFPYAYSLSYSFVLPFSREP